MDDPYYDAEVRPRPVAVTVLTGFAWLSALAGAGSGIKGVMDIPDFDKALAYPFALGFLALGSVLIVVALVLWGLAAGIGHLARIEAMMESERWERRSRERERDTERR